MTRTFTVAAVALLASMWSLSLAGDASADPPAAKLPPLPPPGEPTPLPPPAPKAEPAVVTRVPVELRIAVPDLEKHILRTLVQKIDPKAEPVLPFVVKGNEKEFAMGKDASGKDVAGKDAGPPEAPKPIAEAGEAKDKPEMPAARPQLIPRPPGVRPRLDRLAARPLVAGLVDRVMASIDLTYRIDLRSFKLSLSGTTMTCEAGGGFHCEGKAMPGPAPASPPVLRDIGIKIMVTKSLEWNPNGKLELKEGTTQVWIDPDAPVVGFPRLDIERVVRLNGMLTLLNGTLDRELMRLFTGENLPDLVLIAPTLKPRVPFLALAELTAYPIRGDEKFVFFSFDVGLVGSNKKTSEAVKIATRPGPSPEPQVRGKVTFDSDGKPVVKLQN